MKHVPLKTIHLKNHPELNERWLQDIIAEDPSIIGIGDVILKDKERIHHGAGRLDLLLQDADGNERYEVEIQLGATDESHIIRTIEYWDIERKRYPQYNHTAIIIAEDITSRFLNVISLFNGSIPLMAIQVNAIETSDGVGLHFTKVLDVQQLGLVDEDEEVFEITNRDYWLKRGTPETVAIADKLLTYILEFDSDAELNYNKFYIGLKINGRSKNYAIFRPKKNYLILEIKIPETEENDEIINQAEITTLNYAKRYGCYRLRINEKELSEKSTTLKQLLLDAKEKFG
jgi:predicted transport protein|tara:strand:+ start:45 stop:908 length:864 start_codon:yes stop_codon:yes gene_type:complete